MNKLMGQPRKQKKIIKTFSKIKFLLNNFRQNFPPDIDMRSDCQKFRSRFPCPALSSAT
jgi:hypothetical protein